MSQTLKEKIQERMDELGINPKRSLGQNFLVSDHVVQKIIEAANPQNFYQTTEIGPGLGALTDGLSETSKNFKLVELDRAFVSYWKSKNFDVWEGDALKAPWSGWSWQEGPQLLVSNLPYQISSRLVVDFSILENRFDRMVLMFQKEVAQRITASQGTEDYGLLTVIAQTYWSVHKLLEAGAVDFMPKPRVASRVLVFDKKVPEELSGEGSQFLNFVKLCFAQRRKKLLPRLKSFGSKEQLEARFNELGFPLSLRAESLSVFDFTRLYLKLKNG